MENGEEDAIQWFCLVDLSSQQLRVTMFCRHNYRLLYKEPILTLQAHLDILYGRFLRLTMRYLMPTNIVSDLARRKYTEV